MIFKHTIQQFIMATLIGRIHKTQITTKEEKHFTAFASNAFLSGAAGAVSSSVDGESRGNHARNSCLLSPKPPPI
jgi:hypothetical protein